MGSCCSSSSSGHVVQCRHFRCVLAGWLQGFAYGWDVYMDQVQPVVSKVPFMVVQGQYPNPTPDTVVGCGLLGAAHLLAQAVPSPGWCAAQRRPQLMRHRTPKPYLLHGSRWASWCTLSTVRPDANFMHPGNHERDFPGTGDRYEDETAKDSGGECGVVAEKRFPAPIPAPGQQW